MASREMLRIDPTSRTIIQQHLSQVPVRLGDLAKDLGVSAVKISSMKTGMSGQISKEDGNYVIRVNRNEARERQRFTIAHELAHYLLHQSHIDASAEGITDNVLYRSGAAESIEFEANRLAAELVMPIQALERILSSEFGNMITESTIENLATRFEVSKAAMQLRLERVFGANQDGSGK